VTRDELERPAFTRCVVDTMRDVRFSALDVGARASCADARAEVKR
jgi:hypothetical protein